MASIERPMPVGREAVQHEQPAGTNRFSAGGSYPAGTSRQAEIPRAHSPQKRHGVKTIRDGPGRAGVWRYRTDAPEVSRIRRCGIISQNDARSAGAGLPVANTSRSYPSRPQLTTVSGCQRETGEASRRYQPSGRTTGRSGSDTAPRRRGSANRSPRVRAAVDIGTLLRRRVRMLNASAGVDRTQNVVTEPIVALTIQPLGSLASKTVDLRRQDKPSRVEWIAAIGAGLTRSTIAAALNVGSFGTAWVR